MFSTDLDKSREWLPRGLAKPCGIPRLMTESGTHLEVWVDRQHFHRGDARLAVVLVDLPHTKHRKQRWLLAFKKQIKTHKSQEIKNECFLILTRQNNVFWSVTHKTIHSGNSHIITPTVKSYQRWNSLHSSQFHLCKQSGNLSCKMIDI